MNTLDYFVGKVCTVFTTPFNRDFKAEDPNLYPQQLINYFVGEVESIDDEGIMLCQSGTGLRTFLFRSCLVGIAQEQEEAAKESPPEVTEPLPQPPQSPYLNVDALTSMSKKFAQEFRREP